MHVRIQTLRQTGRQEREVSGVCLHHNKQNVLCFQRTLLPFLGEKNFNSVVISLETDNPISKILKETQFNLFKKNNHKLLTNDLEIFAKAPAKYPVNSILAKEPILLSNDTNSVAYAIFTFAL